jgi:hypothetical protein
MSIQPEVHQIVLSQSAQQNITLLYCYVQNGDDSTQDIKYVFPNEIKGNVISLQAWTNPEFCRRLRLQDFKAVGTRSW